ncbi:MULTISPECIES: hypothetical protein [Burkholderia cepacia complex]|uniref:hypothetical protein n=1 Tax=Burkholderia cepacia complex TaxID=87882 RepID=UPI000F09065B|nr:MULTISPECIES: hypothetical protein [Burkholderia cepacia complex]AYQ43878.1 hypothetical protein CVS37_38590 [Burkholderia lata]
MPILTRPQRSGGSGCLWLFVRTIANAADDWREIRTQAARIADSDDAAARRWFSSLMDERRVRWCQSTDRRLVSVDHPHIATEPSVGSETRFAKQAAERQHTPQPDGIQRARRTS